MAIGQIHIVYGFALIFCETFVICQNPHCDKPSYVVHENLPSGIQRSDNSALAMGRQEREKVAAKLQ
jgi:hypothetical protein